MKKLEKIRISPKVPKVTSFDSVFDADSEYDIIFVEDLNMMEKMAKFEPESRQKYQYFSKSEVSQRRRKILKNLIYTFVARCLANKMR